MDLTSTGSWDAVRHLRKPRSAKHTTIKRPDGSLGDTEERPNVLADYFEKTQWEYKFPALRPEREDTLDSTLPIDTGAINMAELKTAHTARFLEDVGEPPYSVDRMLTHLWMAGKLEQLAGIVLGKFTDDGYDRNTFSMEEVLRNRLEPLGIPTLRGAMIGHVEDKTVVPLGVRARLDADAGALTLLESAVS